MQLINRLLEYLFPTRPDYQLVKQLQTKEVEEKFNPINDGSFLALSDFSDPVIKACVHEVKYHQNERGLKLLALLLKKYLEDKPTHIIVPIPLSFARRHKRGYNQVELIALAATKNVNTNLIRRIKNTAPQTELSRSERLENVKDAFATVVGSKNLTGQNIIILDDVATTGATFKAARGALAPLNPTSITCVAIAH